MEVESLLQSLSDELLKLKSATKHYEETKEKLQSMCASIDKISITHQKLTDNMSEFLAKIGEMDVEGKKTRELIQNTSIEAKRSFEVETHKLEEAIEASLSKNQNEISDEIQKQTDRIVQNSESQSKTLGDLVTKQTDTILQNNESQFRALGELLTKQTDRVIQHSENQSKALRLVKYLVALGVLIEVAVIAVILLL